MPPDAATVPAASRRELRSWLIGTAVAVVVLVGAVLAMGGRIEAATWGLVVAAGSMAFALRALYAMAMALARPSAASTLEQDDGAAAGRRELREERRRVLRAINELQFDYEMGKLSDEDYRKVREGYELRAVEVMRALESESSLHPELEAELKARGLLEGEVAAAPTMDDADGDDEEAEAEADSADEAEAEADSADEAEAEAESADEAEADSADEAEAASADEAEAASADESESDDDVAASVACGSCEGDNDADAKFCKHCGAKLGDDEEGTGA